MLAKKMSLSFQKTALVVRLVFLGTCGAMLILAATFSWKFWLLTGSIVYVLSCLCHLVSEFITARQFRRKQWEPQTPRTKTEAVSNNLAQIIALVGLALVIAEQMEGLIIWCAAIVTYLASGWIARDVAGIPLEMRWGQWKPPRVKK
jgi:uncharacterized membrane protein